MSSLWEINFLVFVFFSFVTLLQRVFKLDLVVGKGRALEGLTLNLGFGSQGYPANDSMGAYGFAPNIPRIRKPMPIDQRAKMLAMHRESRANAGIYVAVVLAVYIVLLTILLCRYTRRQRAEDSTAEGPIPPNADDKVKCPSPKRHCGIWNCYCCSCCCSSAIEKEDSIEIDVPLVTFDTKVESSVNVHNVDKPPMTV